MASPTESNNQNLDPGPGNPASLSLETPSSVSVVLETCDPHTSHKVMSGLKQPAFLVSTCGRTALHSDIPAKADHPSEAIGLALLGYFETMRIPLISGRAFSARDGAKRPPVAIVNQAFARKYFAGLNPVGKHLQSDLGDGALSSRVREIVGVGGNIKRQGLTAESDPGYYLPWAQAVVTTPYLCIRTTDNPQTLEKAVRTTIAAMDPSVPMYQVHDLDYCVSQSAA